MLVFEACSFCSIVSQYCKSKSLFLTSIDDMDKTSQTRPEPTSLGNRSVSVEVRAPSSSSADASSSSKVNLSCFTSLCGASAMVKASFFVNVVLFAVKIYIFVLSGSLSVLASLVDSSVDLLAQGVLMAANRYAERPRSAYETFYPAGVARIEPIGVIICAVIMSLGAFLVVKDAAMTLIGVYAMGEKVPKIELRLDMGAFLVCVVLLKAILWFFCSRLAGKGDVALDAVAQDHRNDVASNSAALIAAAIASNFPDAWMADAIGAIIIGLWIIRAWTLTGKEQADLLVGKAADPQFLDIVRELAETHDPAVTLDVVRAYHFGPKFLVEIELVMAPTTPLLESHDVGILLQHKIECLEECERCFVHIDYQRREINDHDPSTPVTQKIKGNETDRLIQIQRKED
eukprot:TRINITY_DN102506_c0_g1_i1.p1 TRINITY_DN102506_c0_g1~~TRINITY_DN102506_c0_g1_i1.p1  ORF type:complete len:402 (+),score=72.43 TRINITY_DN102506_c0_g1_i1:101-1306(+)